jgi:hypothetical protein
MKIGTGGAGAARTGFVGLAFPSVEGIGPRRHPARTVKERSGSIP